MADLQQLQDQIVGLSLLDAAQLVKMLEEKLGVSAAAAPDKDGALSGDLILRGGGDPVLSVDDLARLARHVREARLARVTGRLVADESLFDGH